MDQMRSDTRYDIALASINSELTMKDTFTRQYGVTQFPEHLKLYNLPSTIMSYYSMDDKKDLFPSSNSTSYVINKMHASIETDVELHEPDVLAKAIIHAATDSTEAKVLLARKGIDKTCPGCGMYGHDVFQTGCDKCAKYILIKQFLDKYPNSLNKIVSKYKEHQSERKKSRNERTTSKNDKPKIPHRFNT